MLAVDGRQTFSRGYTMVEMANMMIDLGADDALNLDGGGSTTMVSAEPRASSRVVNSPSDGFQRCVANALEVTYTAAALTRGAPTGSAPRSGDAGRPPRARRS